MIEWVLKKFDELTPRELYTILQLRNEVFVVEQNCVFQDADNKDFDSHHLMGYKDKKLVAYTRILPPGLAYSLPSIGRVVTAAAVRRMKVGSLLMQKSIEITETLYGRTGIKIGAQLYLKKFYESFGFAQQDEIYIEDGIPHIAMIRPPVITS